MENVHYKSQLLSIHTFIEEFKAVVFEKDKLENRDLSILLAILLPLVNQNSNSNAENKFNKISEQLASLR